MRRGYRRIDMFGQVELSHVLDQRNADMKSEIENENDESFLHVEETRYEAELEGRFRIREPQIHFDQMSISQREEMIPAERFPRFQFHVISGKSYPKQVIRFHIPYDCDEEILRSIPNPRLLWTIPVELEDGNICFDITDFYGDASKIKSEVERITSPMSQQLEHVRENIKRYNQQLPNMIKKLVADQKAKITNRLNVINKLGFPIRGVSYPIAHASNIVEAKRPGSSGIDDLTNRSRQSRLEVQFEWDIFISHASEDKEPFVRDLATQLIAKGLKVWYDDFTLRLGDSLRRSIDNGLARSKYGIVVISPRFFAKEWPQKELDGIVAKERNGEKVLLPIWLDVEHSDVANHSPILADRLAVQAKSGLATVVNKILDAIQK